VTRKLEGIETFDSMDQLHGLCFVCLGWNARRT